MAVRFGHLGVLWSGPLRTGSSGQVQVQDQFGPLNRQTNMFIDQNIIDIVIPTRRRWGDARGPHHRQGWLCYHFFKCELAS